MAYERYSLRESVDGITWAVGDIFTNWPAYFGGMMLDGMDVEEAATLVDHMNALDCQKRVLFAVQQRSP